MYSAPTGRLNGGRDSGVIQLFSSAAYRDFEDLKWNCPEAGLFRFFGCPIVEIFFFWGSGAELAEESDADSTADVEDVDSATDVDGADSARVETPIGRTCWSYIPGPL